MELQELNNWDENGNYGQEAHPPPEILMLSVDGELPADEAARIESHLSACWVCRARTAKIEATIADFIEYDQAALAPHLAQPPNNWRNFDARLDRLAAELGRPALIRASGSPPAGNVRSAADARATGRCNFCLDHRYRRSMVESKPGRVCERTAATLDAGRNRAYQTGSGTSDVPQASGAPQISRRGRIGNVGELA